MESQHYSNALHFYNLGLNITCLTGEGDVFYNPNPQPINFDSNNEEVQRKIRFKSPSHDYSKYKYKRQELTELESLDWRNAHGLGLVLGYSNLSLIDIDNSTSDAFVNKLLVKLDLPEDYEWVVRTGYGYHIYFFSDNEFRVRLKTYMPLDHYEGVFGKIELMDNEGHAVLPNSKHISGRNYKFINGNLPKNLPLNVKKRNLLKSLSEFCDFTKVPLYEDSSHRYYYRTTPFEPFKYAKPSFFMVLDTESNGLPKFFDSDPYKSEDRPEIIQMAWQLYNDDFELIKEKSLLIKPSKKIIWDEQALNLTGLSKEKLEKEGINIKDAMEHFFYDLSASSVVIGHNIEYDLKIIKAEIARNNIDLVAWVPPDNKIIIDFDKLKTFCTMKNTMEFVGIRSSNEFKYPSLNELYQRLFIRKLTNSHNAISDVKATAECFKELVTKYGFSIEGTS